MKQRELAAYWRQPSRLNVGERIAIVGESGAGKSY